MLGDHAFELPLDALEVGGNPHESRLVRRFHAECPLKLPVQLERFERQGEQRVLKGVIDSS